MESVGSFVNIKRHNLYFNGCSECEGHCCNGAKGFAASPLILEDFEEVYQNFPIVFSVNDEADLVVYVMLNDGKGHCKYYSDMKCSIYEHRAPACKLYPVSPYFEHILVDTACPSVNFDTGKVICKDSKLNQDFYTQRLENFVAKREATSAFLDSIKHEEYFSYIGEILGLPLFKYAYPSENRYIQMHQASLKHLSLA
ncbi:YkgJ family cysteine cluster protein [Sulfurospirillum arsenophilum]|uniref:YkgJ family cysteine cluster protein n=1 Tax=Sulfurospirillum arsenophilum TaxID=56698 RepID=UPI0005AB8DA0|nr:YkgJ family cysteine cluster protein [Sulfurospirillum arsenophilum]